MLEEYVSFCIRICSYLLLPLIYLLVNVKIAQLSAVSPSPSSLFYLSYLLLFLERISVKKFDDCRKLVRDSWRLTILFGQSLDASKYVTSTGFVCLYCDHYWHGVEYSFKAISPHNHRQILRFFIWWSGWWWRWRRWNGAISLTGGNGIIMESISKYLIYSNSYVLNFIKFGGKRTTALYFEPAFFRSGINLNLAPASNSLVSKRLRRCYDSRRNNIIGSFSRGYDLYPVLFAGIGHSNI